MDVAGDIMTGCTADLAHKAEVVDVAVGYDDALNITPEKSDVAKLHFHGAKRPGEFRGRVDEGDRAFSEYIHVGAYQAREAGQEDREGVDTSGIGEWLNIHNVMDYVKKGMTSRIRLVKARA
jgi:hypothetical protein